MKKRPKDMPIWQDCVCRRVPCGRSDCPICGRLERFRQKHIAKNEDPDSPAAALEDVAESLAEAKELLIANATKFNTDLSEIDDEAEEYPFEKPPSIDEYPLAQELIDWRKEIFGILEGAGHKGLAWVNFEATKDLAWYANLLPVKTHRLFSAKWGIEHGGPDKKFDYDYTGYVVDEIGQRLDQSLVGLRTLDAETDLLFLVSHSHLKNLLKKIKKSLAW